MRLAILENKIGDHLHHYHDRPMQTKILNLHCQHLIHLQKLSALHSALSYR